MSVCLIILQSVKPRRKSLPRDLFCVVFSKKPVAFRRYPACLLTSKFQVNRQVFDKIEHVAKRVPAEGMNMPELACIYNDPAALTTLVFHGMEQLERRGPVKITFQPELSAFLPAQGCNPEIRGHSILLSHRFEARPPVAAHVPVFLEKTSAPCASARTGPRSLPRNGPPQSIANRIERSHKPSEV